MLQGVEKQTLIDRMSFVNFEDRLVRKIKEATPLRRQVRKMTKVMLHNQDFIASVAAVVKKYLKYCGC